MQDRDDHAPPMGVPINTRVRVIAKGGPPPPHDVGVVVERRGPTAYLVRHDSMAQGGLLTFTWEQDEMEPEIIERSATCDASCYMFVDGSEEEAACTKRCYLTRHSLARRIGRTS